MLHRPLPFVVTQTNGTWQTPTALTGLGSQVTNAQVTSVSCPAAGNCTATGYANPGTFVADDVNGVWGAAHLLPVPDTTGGVYTGATLVSCTTAGNCVVAAESYVYTERNGTWNGGQAIDRPPLEPFPGQSMRPPVSLTPGAVFEGPLIVASSAGQLLR